MIPPKEWRPCGNYDSVDKFTIDTPVSQLVNGQQGTHDLPVASLSFNIISSSFSSTSSSSPLPVGVYQLYNIQKKSLSYQQFKEIAESDRLAYGCSFSLLYTASSSPL